MGALMMHNFRKYSLAAAALVALFGAAAVCRAQYRPDHIPDGPPVAVPNPTITDKPNAQLPLEETEFTTSEGHKIKLGELFNHNKPVIVSLVYFSCPMLCGLNQDALVEAVREGPRSLRLGQDYDIVVVSIDPDDTPATASAKRGTYLSKLDRPATQAGFTYLTGTADNIKKLADAVGFGYRRNYEGDKFLHSTGIFVFTPYGRLSQIIKGLEYTPDELHSSLLLAADNKIGSGFLEKIALPCGAMRLNPLTGKYEHNPWFWAGTAGGAASFAFVAIFLGFLWRGEMKKPKNNASGGSPGQPSLNT
jgi:protein SCO1/2